VLGFAVGAIVVGLVGVIFSRSGGEMSTRAFRGSSWVGLKRSAAEWRRTTIAIGVLLILGGGALLAYSIGLAIR
jgi:hypothetical protein